MDVSGFFAGKHAVTHIDSLQLNLQSMSGLQTNFGNITPKGVSHI